MKSRAAMLSLQILTFALATLPSPALAQYNEWRHHGTIALLTTPNGANLPGTTHEENFPVLVRLNPETFDFAQAKFDGADVRFSSAGNPLAYQIERWDPVHGEACIWVRIPLISGNSRQEITLHWGNPEARSESNGSAVFNESNGYSAVLHCDDGLQDDVGTLLPKNKGTTDCLGAIGTGRRFTEGHGVACGEAITNLPTQGGPCSTEAWIKAERVNGTVVGWGNEQAQGKVVLEVRSPPQVRVDGYFSSADVTGQSRLPMHEWVHVVHVHREGQSFLYLNGKLDATSTGRASPLNVRRPARMWLGGWYNNYRFVGDLDEVRISNVARSANWIQLSYENQKNNQTLVGTLAQGGTTLAVSPAHIDLDEGRSVTLTAQAGGAEKLYWILKRGGEETLLAADRLSCTLSAGRLTNDAAWIVRFKAIFSNDVKVVDVPVTIRNSIPEPIYTLSAPKKWNGRDDIEVVPRLANLTAMKKAGAGLLQYRWMVSGGAVIHETLSDRLVLRRSQYSGPIEVTSFLSNGGPEVEQAVPIQINEPTNDPWIQRRPDPDEKPEQGQFYARDDKDEGTLFYCGTLDREAQATFLNVFADDKPFKSERHKLGQARTYSFAIKLKPGLVTYRVEFGAEINGANQVIDRVGDLVCGDAYLIDGQSNALATDTGEDSPRTTNEWIRSYGGPTGRENGVEWIRQRMLTAQRAGRARPNLWSYPVWKAKGPEHSVELGWWGMELAKGLVASQRMPVCLIQCAVGGSRIDEHQPSSTDRGDFNTLYGRMLWRLRQARLTHGIRAVLWHQGENDQGADGPTGGYGWETYQQFFIALSAAWKQDMPNLQHYYVFQIWPNSCAMGGRFGSGDRLREKQRELPHLYSHMSIVSTLGIRPPGGCHFPLAGWSEFARLVQPMMERDFYGRNPAASITPPDLRKAIFTSTNRDEIELEFDQPITWQESLRREFYVDDRSGEIVSGRAVGKTLILKLQGSTAGSRITYLKEQEWSQDRLLRGANGLAALTFCDVPIELNR